jgi:hypothetical protein
MLKIRWMLQRRKVNFATLQESDYKDQRRNHWVDQIKNNEWREEREHLYSLFWKSRVIRV